MGVFLQELKDYSETKILALITIISIVLTIIFYLLMRPIESELTAQTLFGVIDLEFAWNAEQIDNIFTAWGDELISKEINAVILDFGFLMVYSLSLAGITLILTKSGVSKSWTTYGYYFALFPFFAAGFDAIENINLLLMLSSPSSFPSFAPLVASICATIKFGLIIATILFWVIGLVYSAIKRILQE